MKGGSTLHLKRASTAAPRSRFLFALTLVLALTTPVLAGCLDSGASDGDGASSDGAGAEGKGAGGGAAADGADGSSSGVGAAASGNGSGQRPHVHDFWEGRTELTLLAGEVEIEAASVEPDADAVEDKVALRGCASPGAFCLGSVEFGIPPADDGSEVAIVPPGTQRLEVTLDYDATTITSLRLAYQTAARQGFSDAGVAAPGDTLVITDEEQGFIPVRQTDDGHATVSRWQFRLTAASDGTLPLALADGVVDVTVRAFRVEGELPVEPPHPAWYEGVETYRVADPPAFTAEDAWQVTYLRTDSTRWLVLPENPVPPGTKDVFITLDLDNQSPVADNELLAPEVRVLYTIGFSGFGGGGDDAWLEAAPAGTTGDGALVFRIPVEAVQADSLYSCGSSVWRFLVEVSAQDLPAPDPFGPGQLDGASHFDGSVDAAVMATSIRGASPDELDPQPVEQVEGCEEVQRFFDRRPEGGGGPT